MEKSFGRTNKNKKVIVERGWNPYNRATLLLPEIRATMTTEEMEGEGSEGSNVILPKKPETLDLTVASLPKYDEKFLPQQKRLEKMNYSSGISQLCITEIIRDQDLHTARQAIKADKDTCETLKQKLEKLKKVSAGGIFLQGTNCIGKTIFDIKKQKSNTNIEAKVKKIKEQQKEYDEKVEKAHPIRLKEPDYMKWTAKDLYVVNQSLKQTREDGAIPKKLQLGREKYNEWVNHEPINWNQLIYDM